MNKDRVIEMIESELLSSLFRYAVPFLNKKIKISPAKKYENHNKSLEGIVNARPKIGFNDIKELEKLLLQNLDEDIKANKNKIISSGSILYSLSLSRQKNKNSNPNNYSISVKYEENQSEERLSISINKAEKEIYSAEITDRKDARDMVAPYSIKIDYKEGYSEERLSIAYKQHLKNYIQKHTEDKEDMANRVLLKFLNILPETIMGGVLGYTYLGENFMARRADLTGKTARMVDIHESIHTPDEYETRLLTSWIMEKVKPRYFK